MQKRIMAINDISCYGRCAMTVLLPVLSAAGHECAVMPTALLSTHLAYPGPVSYAMTEEMKGIGRHLKSIQVTFDAIATGYLDNTEQAGIVTAFIEQFKGNDTFVMADPTMADHGKMYANPAYDEKFVESMKGIVRLSDFTTPNITEAAFLTGVEFQEPPHSKAYIERLLHSLIEMGPKMAVVTGVMLDDHIMGPDLIGSACLSADTGEIHYAFANKFKGRFIGTGDLFSAAVLGSLMNGFDLPHASEIATVFVSFAIEKSLQVNTPNSMAINFEQSLPFYMKKLNLV